MQKFRQDRVVSAKILRYFTFTLTNIQTLKISNVYSEFYSSDNEEEDIVLLDYPTGTLTQTFFAAALVDL